MTPSQRIPYPKAALLATASIFFCIATGLSFYSSNQIAMTVGDRHPSTVEQAASLVSIAAQPWLLIAAWMDAAFGFYVLYRSIASTVMTSLVSAAILFSTLRFLFRCWPRWLLPTSACLCIVAGISIYNFDIDTRITEEARSSYEGP